MFKKLKESLKWLDPFTYVDLYVMPRINPKNNKNIETIVYIIFAFIFAYILYNYVLALLLGTGSPLVIVFSGSMEPTLYRGDVVILTGASNLVIKEASVDFPIKNKSLTEYAQIGSKQTSKGYRQTSIKIGEEEFEFDENGPVVVYYSSLSNQDIIHRGVLKLNAPDGEFLLTFGDNNSRLDQHCPPNPRNGDCIAPYPISVEDLNGKYLVHIPLLGYVKLILFDDLPRLVAGVF